MSETAKAAVAVIGIDIGKHAFHVVGLDRHGAIVLRQKWSRGQVKDRLAAAATQTRDRLRRIAGETHRCDGCDTRLSASAVLS
jgi:hypothetical protein